MAAHSHTYGQGAEVALEGLSKSFDGHLAANDVNLKIEPGEFLTLLGPSGSGKTTTLKMIAGLETPTAGDIRINRRSIVALPVHKRNLGMVFQNYALFPHMTVYKNLAFPLEMRGMTKSRIAERVRDALALVQLEPFEQRRPSQLSGGQQQRVALARALVFEPPVLLLDEPLGALDAKLRDAMKMELKALHRKIGTTIIFVTHDQQEALTLSDRIAVFHDGRLAQAGTPDQLYERPANGFVADFIGEANFLTGEIQQTSTDTYRLRIANGVTTRVKAPAARANTGDERTYALRLERLSIADEAEGRSNHYEGVVEEAYYIGDATKYLIRIAPDFRVMAKVSHSGNEPAVATGDSLTVGWDEADMREVVRENK